MRFLPYLLAAILSTCILPAADAPNPACTTCSASLTLPAGSTAPAADRYVFVGSFELNPAAKGQAKLAVDLYRMK